MLHYLLGHYVVVVGRRPGTEGTEGTAFPPCDPQNNVWISPTVRNTS